MAEQKQPAELYSKEETIKMIEHAIIMHLQTKKQLKDKQKNKRLLNIVVEKIDSAINENIQRIKAIEPNYECPYTEDNVEDEVHSGFDPNANGHVEDTLALQSKYSGERNYTGEDAVSHDGTNENDEAAFLKKLDNNSSLTVKDESRPSEEVYSKQYMEDANRIFEKINGMNAVDAGPKDIDKAVEENRKSAELDNAGIKPIGNVEYDLIPIPSHGECYSHKKKRLSVAYMTAYDENMITSPNLYEGNLILEYVLKNKILDKEVNVMDLTKGDADAVLLWLRKTCYGSEYPVTVTDTKTGKPFETVIDLDKIEVKPFSLKGDAEGLFDYHCSKCGADLKFKFVTLADVKALENSIRIESEDVRKNYVSSLSAKIKNLINMDKQLKDGEKSLLVNSMTMLDKWTETKSAENYSFSYTVTDMLERMIVSVNGNRDRDEIHKFVMKMPALDALMFRKYVNDNEPAVDFLITVDRPADLGGGQLKTFLNWDKFIFTNTTQL